MNQPCQQLPLARVPLHSLRPTALHDGPNLELRLTNVELGRKYLGFQLFNQGSHSAMSLLQKEENIKKYVRRKLLLKPGSLGRFCPALCLWWGLRQSNMVGMSPEDRRGQIKIIICLSLPGCYFGRQGVGFA